MARALCKIIVAVIWFFFAACSKEEPAPSTPPPPGERRMFVVCEGSLGYGNGKLDLYLPEKDSVFQNVFEAVNGGELGDVFQSMTAYGGRLFLCVNNSDKLVILNRQDLSIVATLNVTKPRYILQTGTNKFYVSSLYNNQVQIIDSTGTQTGSVTFKGRNMEGMLQYGDQVFVCPWDTTINYIYVVSRTTDQVTDSYQVAGYAPQEVVLDKEQKLWVLSGNAPKGKAAALTRLDPATGAILQSFAFPPGAQIVRLVTNNARDSVYFIGANQDGGTDHNGVYRMGIHDAQLPQQPFVPAQAFQYFWALGIDPSTGHIYVGDPKGFNQKGTVLVYQSDGTLLRQFNCSLGPGHFYFD